MKPPSQFDWVLLMLFCGMFMALWALFLSEKWFPMDGQMFQVVAGLVTGLSGALLTKIKGGGPQAPPPGASGGQQG